MANDIENFKLIADLQSRVTNLETKVDTLKQENDDLYGKTNDLYNKAHNLEIAQANNTLITKAVTWIGSVVVIASFTMLTSIAVNMISGGG